MKQAHRRRRSSSRDAKRTTDDGSGRRLGRAPGSRTDDAAAARAGAEHRTAHHTTRALPIRARDWPARRPAGPALWPQQRERYGARG
jgi:hypothetical protein